MKIFYTLTACILFLFPLSAQNGLERIIVEKYYVSNVNDKSEDADGGELPVNSVTYRVFVDMLPDYIFQAAFGTPEHELKIATTTAFFNNEDRGARFPTYSRSNAQNNTVMLDSWLSAGAGLKDYAGVLKEMDNGVNTIVNADRVLQNEHLEAGIPLTIQDGVIESVVEPVTVVGFFDTDLAVLDDANDASSPTIISTHDGAWSSLNGSMGPDSNANIVLIGQFTTDGVFEFELNLQIRNQVTLGVETYVARNATGTEILFPKLIHIDSLGFMSATEDVSGSDEKINVFPNPASENIFIEIDKDIALSGIHNRYMLSSLAGHQIIFGHITEHTTLVEMKYLLPGSYFLSIELENGMRYSTNIIRVR